MNTMYLIKSLKKHIPLNPRSDSFLQILPPKPQLPRQVSHYSTRPCLPSLLDLKPYSSSYDNLNIELVDPDTWRVSSGLSESWKLSKEKENMISREVEPIECDSYEDIEDMRLRGMLVYKVEKDSKEYEEYGLNLSGKKSAKKNRGFKESMSNEFEKMDKVGKEIPGLKGRRKKELIESAPVEATRTRVPTFNQLTDPYHEPFCLDIFISKSSVRACIIHRVTSKVVVVAHSISKDMKSSLASTKDYNACVAVGEVLAQRALDDDIHDIVYTPRKGEIIEGKLKKVLESVIEHGINVKVKFKKVNTKKVVFPV